MAKLAASLVEEQLIDVTSKELSCQLEVPVDSNEQDDSQEQLERPLRHCGRICIGNACGLPAITSHVKRKAVNAGSGSLTDVICPCGLGVRVRLAINSG